MEKLTGHKNKCAKLSSDMQLLLLASVHSVVKGAMGTWGIWVLRGTPSHRCYRHFVLITLYFFPILMLSLVMLTLEAAFPLTTFILLFFFCLV